MSKEIEVIDLGKITEKTRGADSMVLQELGTPPFNWLFLTPGPWPPGLDDPTKVADGSQGRD